MFIKKNIPKNIAVKGSSTTRIAVFINRIIFIEILIVSIKIIVGNIANPIT